MNYQQALAYLDTYVNFEIQPPGQAARTVFTLERIMLLAARLGNPEKDFPSIHIAGTKGKGSTASFCESIARAAGLHTGCYTSPHLIDLRERIRLDGRPVSKKLLARTLCECHSAYQQIRSQPGQRRLTYFEALTHLAFQIFSRRKIDLGIIEVGMGGRLDATNIIRPLVSVITRISRDHTAQLGHSLRLIAGEKAGICKPRTPLLVAPQPAAALAAITSKARETGARPVIIAGKDFDFTQSAHRPGRWREMKLQTPAGVYENLRVPLLGAHQLENAALAVATMETAARGAAFQLSETAIRLGLLKTRWPGRLEVVRATPALTVLDGAHNQDSIKQLLTAIKEEFPDFGHLVVLFASAADKDVRGMLKTLAGRSEMLVATETGNPRSIKSRQLATMARSSGISKVLGISDISKALHRAWKVAGKDGLVLVTGSLYLVGRAQQALKRNHQSQ
jgi:dihydrofolate synthase / folylpolyglutamate synthase